MTLRNGHDSHNRGRGSPAADPCSLPEPPNGTPGYRYGHHPLHDPSRRPLHVIVVGSGPSGLASLIELAKLPHVTFQCYEKNRDVGGTWFETRYPGAACDVASHAYQYSFQSKKDWSRHFAPAEEIGDYFISVARANNLYPFITFDSCVVAAQWDESNAKWVISVAGSGPDYATSQYEADVLINAGGILNDWKWPDIEGMDAFKGQIMHTAAWDSSIDLKKKNIAVIGSGASSIQVVPSVQTDAQRVDVYVRSPTYILPTVGFGVESGTFNQSYSDIEIGRFISDPNYYKTFRKAIEQQMNENFANSIKSTEEHETGRQWAENMMRKAIRSPELQEKLIPKWELGCRRLTPGLPYLKAVQEPNVDVIRTGIRRITQTGVETDDGQIHEVDVIICATGFNTSFASRYEIVGRNNQSLKDMWKTRGPEAYMGMAVAGLPNYFTLLGPNCPIANGSLMPCIESSVAYITKALNKMQKDQIRTLEVKQEMQDSFNEYVQSVHQDLVWTGSCNSWYKDRSTGRVIAVWPGSSIHFMEMVESPRWEDYKIDYVHPNPFTFMGNGISQRESKGSDLTYYLDGIN